jgi:hypothetical protein
VTLACIGARDGVTGKGIEVGNGKLTLADEKVPSLNHIVFF